MNFRKEDLINLVEENYKGEIEVMQIELVDTTRWSIVYSLVLKFKNRFYQTSFTRGATENQDESPFEYEDDEIDCSEVTRVEKTVTVYEAVG